MSLPRGRLLPPHPAAAFYKSKRVLTWGPYFCISRKHSKFPQNSRRSQALLVEGQSRPRPQAGEMNMATPMAGGSPSRNIPCSPRRPHRVSGRLARLARLAHAQGSEQRSGARVGAAPARSGRGPAPGQRGVSQGQVRNAFLLDSAGPPRRRRRGLPGRQVGLWLRVVAGPGDGSSSLSQGRKLASRGRWAGGGQEVRKACGLEKEENFSHLHRSLWKILERRVCVEELMASEQPRAPPGRGRRLTGAQTQLGPAFRPGSHSREGGFGNHRGGTRWFPRRCRRRPRARGERPAAFMSRARATLCALNLIFFLHFLKILYLFVLRETV